MAQTAAEAGLVPALFVAVTVTEPGTPFVRLLSTQESAPVVVQVAPVLEVTR